MANPSDAQDYARPRAEAAGLHWPTYERQIQQESGWAHWRADGSVKASPTGSMGLGQLNSRFYPRSDWEDPYTNLAKSIEIMASYLKRFGSYRYALASYNWGPGNVGGYTKPDGTVVPPWDGRRETISAQGAHYLDVILGPGWPEPTATNEPGPTPVATTFEDYRDPGHAQFARMPKGVVLHGSRSGKAGNPLDAEYTGTANWELNNPNGYAWHATIGAGRVAMHLTAREWGQHDPWASQEYLGVEFAQPTVNDTITDAQVDAFCDWFTVHVLPVWPSIPLHFPSHAEVDREYGQNQGKTDAYPLNDPRMDALRARIMARLKPQEPPVHVPDEVFAQPGEVGSGLLEMMAEDGTTPAMPSTFLPLGSNPSIAEWAIGLNGYQYLFHIPTGRRWRYPPAA